MKSSIILLLSLALTLSANFLNAQQHSLEPVAYLSFCDGCNELGVKTDFTLDKKGNIIKQEFKMIIKLSPEFIEVGEGFFTLMVEEKKFTYTLVIAEVSSWERNILFEVIPQNGLPVFVPILDEGEIVHMYIDGGEIKINNTSIKNINFACFKDLEHLKKVVEQQKN